MTASSSPNEHRYVVPVLAYAGIVAAIMQTLVVPLIAALPTILGTSASNASWVITVTLLTAAVSTPVAGRLGDMYGKHRMVMVLTVPMIAGSIVCALSSSVTPMIIGRGLQGLGMGIVPLGISLLRDLVPPAKLHSSIALMSASMGVGGALGLPFAAAIAENISWRILFWVVAVMSLLIAVAVGLAVPAPRSEPRARARFDVLGAVGLAIVLVCILLAVSKGSDWGWGSTTVLALLIVIVALTPLWAWWELRRPHPLLNLRVAARPQVLWTNLASVLVGFAMFAQTIVLPQILQLPVATGYGLGQSMVAMGLWMAPAGIFMMAFSPVGAKITQRYNAKITLASGALLIAAGYASGLLLLGSTWGILVVTLLCSAGTGLAYGAMPVLIMGAVPSTETGSANGFNAVMRSFGSAVGAAVMGAVLARLTTDFGGFALPSLTGFKVALVIGAAVAALAAAIALGIPLRTEPDDAPEAALADDVLIADDPIDDVADTDTDPAVRPAVSRDPDPARASG